jgi:ribosomal protein S12 methylthiotransferase accessory factor YcaO
LGPLGEVTERDFTQLPLAVSQVPVSDPVRLLGPGVPLPVATGVGVSHDDARRAAVLRGLATYGSLMLDPRRLHVRADADDPRSGDPEADLAALVSKRWTGFVWGHRLMDGRAHEVPATAVFPALDGGRERYSPPVGVAAGYGWTEAVEDALVAQCRRLTVTEIGEDRPSITAIEWKQLSLDGRGAEYRSMIETITDGLRVYDVTGSPGVPTLAFCLDGVTLAYASGLSFADALRDGLEEVLLWHQARWTGEIGYAPADVPPLALSGPVSLVADCPTWTTDTLAVVARLERLGWTAVAVPLDHDPAVTDSIMPYIVNLVLTRA